MTTFKEIGKLGLGKGCTLTFYVDSSKPKDSLDYHYSEVFYDGEPESDVPNVPSHWHKLHDEHMKVVQGRAEFFMDGRSYVRGPGDPTLERTNPVDEGLRKDDFFQNMLEDGNISMGSAFRAAYVGDAVLVLTGIKPIDEVARLVLGGLFTWWYPRKHEGKLPDGLLVQ